MSTLTKRAKCLKGAARNRARSMKAVHVRMYTACQEWQPSTFTSLGRPMWWGCCFQEKTISVILRFDRFRSNELPSYTASASLTFPPPPFSFPSVIHHSIGIAVDEVSPAPTSMNKHYTVPHPL
ncbi:hypothetical protein BaRGS_00018013 [Batillaria attramentaria]|uniref:Uncharacterized protein n=1 Tax=Batillaria attramentaria TaxID=370345 RepID=A0ABD0KUA7_9CAEN